MKQLRNLLTVFLVVTLSVTALAGQANKGKRKVAGTTSLESGNTQKEDGTSAKGKKREKAGTTKLILIPIEDEKTPPPPRIASLLVITNAPGSLVTINKTLKFITNDKGRLNEPVNLKTQRANVVVTHDDFLQKSASVNLVFGRTSALDVTLISKYGTLVLGGIPEGAKILIDGEEKKGERNVVEGATAGIDQKLKVEKALLERVPTGERKLMILHPDYQDWAGSFNVEPGKSEKNFLAPSLLLALSQLSVKAAPGNEKDLAGAKVYIDNEDKGLVSSEGKQLIPDIRFKRNEKYKIKVSKVGYEDWDIDKSLIIGSNEIEVKLLLKRNSDPFEDSFVGELSKEIWDAPPDWKTEEGWLKIQGEPKLGFPSNASYRDSIVQFTLQMVNGKGAAWAVRIQKESKDYGYYLFYLGGPQGRFPGLFRTYLCRNGQFDFGQANDSVSSIFKITSTDLYTIRILVRGNKIEHFITKETGPDRGHEFPLGVYNDKNSFFTFGNVGFRTIDGEVVRINDFHIKPLSEGEKIADK